MRQLRLFAERETCEVVVIDQNSLVFERVRRRVRRAAPREYRFRHATDLEAAFELIAAGEVDVVVLVVVTDDPSGLTRLNRLRSADVALPVVVIHHGTDPDAALDAVVTGAQDVLSMHDATGLRLHNAFMAAVARKRAELQALAEVHADPVTGLATRRWMLEALARAIAHGDERREWQVGLLFIDLDRFKLVNDTLGHAAGDELLRTVADRLKAVVRTEDRVARYGGDEFVILVEGHKIADLAHRIALRCLAAFSDPFVIEGQPFAVHASIGLAIRSPGEPAETLMHHADSALYRAKRRGRNRVVLFDDDLRDWASNQADMAEAVTAAIRSGAMDAIVDHVWDLRTDRRIGHRLDVTWGGAATADVNLRELAAAHGLALDLGRWMLERALVGAAEDALSGATGLRWWVDLPVGLLSVRSTATWLADRCRHHGVDPSVLVCSVVERELADIGPALPQIEALAELGVSVGLRGFGVGVSSLHLFSSAEVDEVRLSGELCRGVATNSARFAMVAGLARIADAVGQQLVAGGPLSREDLDAVRAAGCHLAVMPAEVDLAPTDLTSAMVLPSPTEFDLARLGHAAVR